MDTGPFGTIAPQASARGAFPGPTAGEATGPRSGLRSPDAVGFPAVLLALASLGTPLHGLPAPEPVEAVPAEPAIDEGDRIVTSKVVAEAEADADAEADSGVGVESGSQDAAAPATLALPDTVTLDRSTLRNLDPGFVTRLRRVAERMWDEHELRIAVVEGYRSQERQEALFAQGRITSGSVVTWTTSSRHTDGEAVDVLVDGAFVTPEAAVILERITREEGLNTLYPFDSGHIQLDGPGGGHSSGAPPTRPVIVDPTVVPAGPSVAVPARVAPVARPARPGGVVMIEPERSSDPPKGMDVPAVELGAPGDGAPRPRSGPASANPAGTSPHQSPLTPSDRTSRAPSEAPVQSGSTAPAETSPYLPTLAPGHRPSRAPSEAPVQSGSTAPAETSRHLPTLAPSDRPSRAPSEAPVQTGSGESTVGHQDASASERNIPNPFQSRTEQAPARGRRSTGASSSGEGRSTGRGGAGSVDMASSAEGRSEHGKDPEASSDRAGPAPSHGSTSARSVPSAPLAPVALGRPAGPPTQDTGLPVRPPAPVVAGLDLPEQAPQAVSRLHLPLDAAVGSGSLQVSVRGGSVEAQINVADPLLAGDLKRNLHELRSQLSSRGIEAGGLAVRLVSEAPGVPSLRTSADSHDVRGEAATDGRAMSDSNDNDDRPSRSNDRAHARDRDARARKDRQKERDA